MEDLCVECNNTAEAITHILSEYTSGMAGFIASPDDRNLIGATCTVLWAGHTLKVHHVVKINLEPLTTAFRTTPASKDNNERRHDKQEMFGRSGTRRLRISEAV